MREATLEKQCKKFAKSHGWQAYKFASPAHRFVPDDVFLRRVRGRSVIFWCEFKAPGKVPSLAQENEHQEMREHGADVAWTDNFEKFRELLAEREK